MNIDYIEQTENEFPIEKIPENIVNDLKEAFDYANENQDKDTIELERVINAIHNLGHKTAYNEIKDAFDVFMKRRSQSQTENYETKSIYFNEFLQLYIMLGLIKENDLHEQAFLNSSPIAYNHSQALVTIHNNQLMECQLGEDDEIQIFLKRNNAGYGLQPEKNVQILLNSKDQFNQKLIDFWQWMQKCLIYEISGKNSKEIDPKKGILNITNLNQDDDNISQKLQIFEHMLYQSDKRIMGLNLLGWCEIKIVQNKEIIDLLQNSQLQNLCEILMQQGQHFRACALAVFHFDYSLALKCLDLIQNDNTHLNQIIFLQGVLTGMKNIQSLLSKDPWLRQQFYKDENLKNLNQKMQDQQIQMQEFNKINNIDLLQTFDDQYIQELSQVQPNILRLQLVNQNLLFLRTLCNKSSFSDPYLRCICRFISFQNNNDSAQIVNDLEISCLDRLGYALRFLSSSIIIPLFKQYSENAKKKGYIDMIILEGNQDASIEMVQEYLDTTADIQTVGLAANLFKLMKFPKEQVLQNWINEHQSLLNKFQLWKGRMEIDKDIYDLQQIFKQNQVQQKGNESSISQRCYFCNCALGHFNLLNNIGVTKKGYTIFRQMETKIILNCPDCLKPLPQCTICLKPVGVVNPYLEFQEKHQNKIISKKIINMRENLKIGDALVWCLTCRHGGHLKHIQEWFKHNNECPVTECKCECFSL